MPIIINEFEITAPRDEQPQSESGLQAGRRQPEPRPEAQLSPEPLRPEDIERIMRRFYMRRSRLWAD